MKDFFINRVCKLKSVESAAELAQRVVPMAMTYQDIFKIIKGDIQLPKETLIDLSEISDYIARDIIIELLRYAGVYNWDLNK